MPSTNIPPSKKAVLTCCLHIQPQISFTNLRGMAIDTMHLSAWRLKGMLPDSKIREVSWRVEQETIEDSRREHSDPCLPSLPPLLTLCYASLLFLALSRARRPTQATAPAAYAGKGKRSSK
jgi:hypothetical protein